MIPQRAAPARQHPWLTINAKVLYYGVRWTVGAIGCLEGERYVWLVRDNEVAMLPWVCVDREECRL